MSLSCEHPSQLESPTQPSAPGDPKSDRQASLGQVEVAEDAPEIIYFKDSTGMPCDLRQANVRPGHVWLGIGNTGSMLLDKDKAAKLAQTLLRWCESNSFKST